MRSSRTILISLVLAAAAVSLCAAQAQYTEGFDNLGPVNPGQHGPSSLIAAGWIFRNQSQPASSGTWRSESFGPQSGSASLTVDVTVAGSWSASASASSWAILPPIPGQVS